MLLCQVKYPASPYAPPLPSPGLYGCSGEPSHGRRPQLCQLEGPGQGKRLSPSEGNPWFVRGKDLVCQRKRLRLSGGRNFPCQRKIHCLLEEEILFVRGRYLVCQRKRLGLSEEETLVVCQRKIFSLSIALPLSSFFKSYLHSFQQSCLISASHQEMQSKCQFEYRQ